MDRGAVRGPADRGHGGDRGAGRSLPGSRPALRGEYIEIYATGLGQVSRLQGDGQPKPPTSAPAISALPTVTIGGAPATVTFSGLAPGAVGLFQINAMVPPSAAAGDAIPVVIAIGAETSNTVTIAVR
jgi:minor extracellular serine protease Vpr